MRWGWGARGGDFGLAGCRLFGRFRLVDGSNISLYNLGIFSSSSFTFFSFHRQHIRNSPPPLQKYPPGNLHTVAQSKSHLRLRYNMFSTYSKHFTF